MKTLMNDYLTLHSADLEEIIDESMKSFAIDINRTDNLRAYPKNR
jgi:hypothetical protein